MRQPDHFNLQTRQFVHQRLRQIEVFHAIMITGSLSAAGRLLPGTSATAVIGLAGSRDALLIPRDALLTYPDGSHSVFIVRDAANGGHIALQRRVKIGRGGTQVEILEGLQPGERVVVRGNERLRNRQLVRITAGS